MVEIVSVTGLLRGDNFVVFLSCCKFELEENRMFVGVLYSDESFSLETEVAKRPIP
jgi:hypothetical protein